MKTYFIQIINIQKETDNAVSLSFDIPPGLYETFSYKPGQYITLIFNLNGKEVRRSYSIFSNPFEEEPLQIAVKRVEKGLVSNHINDHLKIGDFIEVLPPEGHFSASIDPKNYKSYYLFAAGSGITPILSIIKSVLNQEPESYLYVLYGNSNENTIMFKKELDKFQNHYENRLFLQHILSRPKSKWSDLWEKEKPYKTGRIDETSIKAFINENPPYAQNAEYYICGPGSMIEHTKNTLKTLDVPEARIFFESFGSNTKDTQKKGVESLLTFELEGEKHQIHVPENDTILRAILDAGHKPNYGCEGGVCGKCVAKTTQGETFMNHNMALSDDEVKSGMTLTCQAHPKTHEVSIVFQE